MAGDESHDQIYGGWQLERVAFLFGLSGRRAALLGVAVLALLWPVATTRMSQAAVLWPAAVVLGSATMARVAGRTGDEWLASTISYAAIRARGQHRFAGGPYLPPATRDDSMMELPGILAPLRILAIPAAGRDLAVVSHPLDRTYTAVARVTFPGIALNDSARQHHRIDRWGTFLASLCTEGTPITRIQALQTVVPESGVALRSWHDAHLVPGAPDLALRVSRELLAAAPVAASRRESYLAVTLDARRARSSIKAAGGGDAGAAAVLVRHLKALSQALAGADLEVQDWLGARELAEVIRTAYDPGSARALDTRRAVAQLPPAQDTAGVAPGVSPRHAGPVHAEALAGCYRHDGAVSVSYWVSEWPRAGAYCTVLAPLLGDGAGRKSFCIVIEPLGPRAAERVVMRDRTARDVAVRMRQRTGQVVPEHEHAAMAMAAAQDAERAAGHGLVRFTAYATVTVTDPGTLEDACAALEADAAAARIDLRRMWLCQDTGFVLGALPLGLGLPRRRW